MPGPDDDPTVVIPSAGLPAAPAPRRSRRPLIVVLAAAAAAVVVFAASLATVTLLETVKGGPLSGGTGLSIQGGNTSPNPQPTTDPTTVTVTTSPTSRTSTPAATATVTQTLTRSPTPSPTPTPALHHRCPHVQRPILCRQRTAQHPRVRGHRRSGQAAATTAPPPRDRGAGCTHAPDRGATRPTAATTQ